jgi:hypothetical protein
MMKAALRIEQTGAADVGPCDCCGRNSRRVWGLAHDDRCCLAAYFVHWTVGHAADRGVNIDLIMGKWGEGAGAEKRSAVALAYRMLETGPTLMVIDASERPMAESNLVGHVLSREQVIGTPIAEEVFAVADAILAQDDRIAEVLGGWTVPG